MEEHPGVIEVLDAPTAAGAAASMLARLAGREEQRAANSAKRLEELQVAADPRESVERFLEEFAARRQQLEEALHGQEACGAGAGADTAAAGGGDAAALAEQIAELEQAVAEAAYFLPAYDLRQATVALGVLRERQEAAAAALQPRKKFSFARKTPPTAAAAAGASSVATPSNGPALPAAAGGTGTAAAAAAQQAAGAAATGSGPAGQQQSGQPAQQQTGDDGSLASSNGVAVDSSSSSSGSIIAGLRGQVVAPARAAAAGQEFTLSDLEDCTIFLLAPLAALFMHGLRRCRIYTGPVAGACLIEDVKDSTLMLAARQVRIHAAEGSDFYLRVRSHPIIEHSVRVRFAPYACCYEGGEADLAEQGLREESGMWQQVNDFGWLRAAASPHWSLVPEGERQAPAAAPAEQAGSS